MTFSLHFLTFGVVCMQKELTETRNIEIRFNKDFRNIFKDYNTLSCDT